MSINSVFKKFFHFIFLCVCLHVYRVHAWCLRRSGGDIDSPGSTVRDDCEPSCSAGIEPESSGRAVSALSHLYSPHNTPCSEQVEIPQSLPRRSSGSLCRGSPVLKTVLMLGTLGMLLLPNVTDKNLVSPRSWPP